MYSTLNRPTVAAALGIALLTANLATPAEAGWKIGGWVGKQWEGTKRAVGHFGTEVRKHPAETLVAAAAVGVAAGCIASGGVSCAIVATTTPAP